MLLLLIFLQIQLDSAMSVNFNKKCSCRKYATETNCKELTNCKWENKMCQEKACTDYLNQVNCDKAANCAWNISKCTQFTACGDYFASDPFDCFKKGDDSDEKWCQPSEDNYCQNYQYQNCARGIDEITCSGFESFWSLCYWNQNKCLSIDVRKCSALVTKDLCLIYGKNLGCTWNTNVCKNYKCSDFTSEYNCVIARQDDITESTILCKWNTSTIATEKVCLEAENTNHLTSDNCYNYTLYTHLWDTTTSTCLSCDLYKDASKLLLEVDLEPEGSFRNVIPFTLSLMALMI